MRMITPTKYELETKTTHKHTSWKRLNDSQRSREKHTPDTNNYNCINLLVNLSKKGNKGQRNNLFDHAFCSSCH